jgi:hypothetical protein
MYMRHRHRRGTYPLAGPERSLLPRGVRWLLWIGAVILVGYLLWSAVLKIFGLDNSLVRAGALLTVEDRGTVNVMIEGQQQRAENGVMLFPDESVSTGAGAHATILFFDGTTMRLEENSDLTIDESSRGERESVVAVTLKRGSAWVLTPAPTGSGTVTRSVTTPALSLDLPSGTEAVVTQSLLAVFSADGAGISVKLPNIDAFTISEGQQWQLPSNGQVGGNVFAYRSPLDPLYSRSAFVVESRRRSGAVTGTGSTLTSSSNASTDILTVTSPQTGMVVTTPVITVKGTFAPGVTDIMINGYPAVVDVMKGTFTQQVSPPDGAGDFEIRVQALDSGKAIVGEVRRVVKRTAAATTLEAPTITSPAKTGQVYNTLKEELVLRGGAPRGATSITVNDYKLQLFDPSKGEWSYVASLRLGNMVAGSNVYQVMALDAAGNKSPVATITIVQGQSPEGVVAGAVTSGGTTSTPAPTGPLPNNAPLLPGSLSITAPTAGTSHVETGTGFLIEGLTSAQTASVYVNDYKLQLYKAGKTTWNYIADVALNNLKPGKNTYSIVVRNAKDEILDKLDYVVDYTPGAASSSN